MRPLKALKTSLVAVAAMVGLSACEGSGTSVPNSAYYDSMMWNDYYYGFPERPNRPPPTPEPPKPVPPIARPPVVRPPIARPPVARPPIHRPPVSRPSPRV